MTPASERARDLLDAATRALGSSPPARRVVAYDTPTLDTPEQLSVHVAGVTIAAGFTPDDPHVRESNRRAIPVALLVLRVTRCTPVPSGQGDPPDSEEIQAAALRILADLDALVPAIRDGVRDGSLWSSPCLHAAFDAATAIPDEGGSGGWEIRVVAHL